MESNYFDQLLFLRKSFILAMQNEAKNRNSIRNIVQKLDSAVKQINVSSYRLDPFKLEIYNECLYILWRFESTCFRVVPKILFASLPKSGTKQVENLLKFIEYNRMHAPYSNRGNNGLDTDLWESTFYDRQILTGRYFLTGHIAATDYNTFLINKTGTTLLLLLRNPIQALVSWCYYIESLNTTHGTYVALSSFERYGILFSENKINYTNTEIRQFMIQTVYPRTLKFIANWMQQIKQIDEDQYLLLSQEQMTLTPEKFYESILLKLKHKTSQHQYIIEELMSKTNHNFRKGSTSEWKDYFSQDEINRLIPAYEKLIDENSKLAKLFLI